MNKIKNKSIYVIVFIFTILFLARTENYAASATVNFKDTVTVNEPVTISVSGSGVQWRLQLVVDGNVIAENSELENYESNKTISFSGQYTPTTVGNKSIELRGTVTEYSNGETITSFASKTLKVEEAVQPEPTTPEQPTEPENPTTPEQPNTPEQPTTPTVTKPEFTSVNRTMYTTGEANLRDSWSTRSAATKVQKGTELTVTGTSSNKVNDYVWYRVNYNGTTKYIASYLLTNTKPEEKSNNVNLKSLEIEEQELSPAFSPETTSYTIQIAEEVTKLEIKAEAEDEKATVTINGNEELKEGENIITITVTAEDGTTKNYEIKVAKLANGVEKLGLTSLKIKDTSIATMFKPEVYNYEIDIKDVTELEIEAIANDETATIEILGNENLQEGENIITIIVSAKEGEEKVTYQIKANKIVKAVEEGKKIDSKIYLYTAIGAVILIALVIVIVYTIKHRNQDEYEYTDNVDELPEELPERQHKEQESDREREKKTKIDYFLDSEEEEEKTKNRRGKHF